MFTFARTSSFLSLMYRDHFSDMHISISVSCSLLNASVVVNGRGETQSTLVPLHEFKMILGLLVLLKCCGSFLLIKALKEVSHTYIYQEKKMLVQKVDKTTLEIKVREKTLMSSIGVNRRF